MLDPWQLVVCPRWGRLVGWVEGVRIRGCLDTARVEARNAFAGSCWSAGVRAGGMRLPQYGAY